ncbi:hypothetical protein MASR2M16_03590 [Thauera terpenica]
MNIEELLRKAIAAEAKATKRSPGAVAKVWALTYADTAVALFESLWPNNRKARTLLDVARAYHSRQADLADFDRAWRAFKNSSSSHYGAARRAHAAILTATDAVRGPLAIERLAEAAVALREAERLAPGCPLASVGEFLSAHHEHP